ncbi:MAG TPA: sigma-54 dependent transcriptional regulator [Bacteroidota bacterium]
MGSSILVVDHEESVREYLTGLLTEERYRVRSAGESGRAIAALRDDPVDLVLVDRKVADDAAGRLLETINEADPAPLVILMTDDPPIDGADARLTPGSHACIRKPLEADAVKSIVRLALEARQLRMSVAALRRRDDPFGELIGETDGARALRVQIHQIAENNDATVLVMGESGTGKELTARAIHNCSARRDGPFVDINCASLPPNLLESELFGFERGAFTDARARKRGYFEMAEGGTLFLDEIAEMSTPLQAKLLRVLEQRTVRHLGGTEDLPVNVRVIAATNQDIRALVREGRFRNDLYYRLNVVPIHLTPLRDRAGDIPLLLEHYRLTLNARLSRNCTGFGGEAMAALCRYAWPGNVRELKNLLERVLILYNPAVIEIAHLAQEILSPPAAAAAPLHLTLPPEGLSLAPFLASVEDELVRLAMERTAGNVTQAARLLNVPRETLRYKLSRVLPGGGKTGTELRRPGE